VDVMHDRIKNGANLLEDHVFQFDFLNDPFDKLPTPLQNVISDEQKRKKLIIYINPPYAEAGDSKQRTGTGKNKEGTSTKNLTYDKYKSTIGKASNELFAQFLIRIYCEIPTARIANFSTLKNLQSSNFSDFRKQFKAKLEKIFLVPAKSFDNVKGNFPIGFFIWNMEEREKFEQISADVYNLEGNYETRKVIFNCDERKSLTLFTRNIKDCNLFIGHFAARGNDFQNQNAVFIDNSTGEHKGGGLHIVISEKNLMKVAISIAVRKVIPATWLNDRDQFLYPNDRWKTDATFQTDCLTFALFHGQNRISANEGTNHWIPFTEQEVNARERFDSRFMIDFIAGKIKQENNGNLFVKMKTNTIQREFSPEAQAVFAAGKALWRYYHSQPNCNVNASLYDIREHFQGRNDKGKMNNKSDDEHYTSLISDLREQLKILAKKIEPKVYEYGFLK
jgi:hypothetical protein